MKAQHSYGNAKNLTNVGGKSLEALVFGADKNTHNELFTLHLINIIKQELENINYMTDLKIHSLRQFLFGHL